MTTTDTTIPAWCAIRGTVINGRPYDAGGVVSCRVKPSCDWAPANDAAREIAPDVRLGMAEQPTRAPMANMAMGHVDRHGVPHMHFLRGVQTVDVALAPPKWRYMGEHDFAVAGGGVRRRREVFSYEGWPSDEGMEPANDTARVIAAYYANHTNDEFLPWEAWNQKAGTFCSEIVDWQRRTAATETLAFNQAMANQPAPATVGPVMLPSGVARRGV